jgi:serine/threonine protein kinase
MKKEKEPIEYTPDPFVVNMRTLINHLKEISTPNNDSHKYSFSEKENKIFEEILNNIRREEMKKEENEKNLNNMKKEENKKISREYVSTMLMRVLNENDIVERIAEHVPTIVGMYAFGHSYFLLMKHSGHTICKSKNAFNIKMVLSNLETEKQSLLESDDNNNNNNNIPHFKKLLPVLSAESNDNDSNNNDDVSHYMDLLPVLSAMDILGIVHRDIRMANVVRDAKGKMTLIDFAYSCYANESVSFAGGLHCASPYVLGKLNLSNTKFEVSCEDDLISWIYFFVLARNKELQERFDLIPRWNDTFHMAAVFSNFWNDIDIFPAIEGLSSSKKEGELKAKDIWYIWRMLPQLVLFESVSKDYCPNIKTLEVLKNLLLTLVIISEKIKANMVFFNFEDLLEYFNLRRILKNVISRDLLERYKNI